VNTLDQIATDLERLHQRHAAEFAALAERHAAEHAAVAARLRAALQNDAIGTDPPSDLITPGVAVQMSGLSRATVHRLCTENQLNPFGGGFAVWDAARNRYQISRSRFQRFIELRTANET